MTKIDFDKQDISDIKISEEELSIKKDWIVCYVNHERYTFDNAIEIFKNKSIIDILDYWMLKDLSSKIERAGYHGFGYALDNTYHEDKESDTWCLRKEENERFLPLHVEWLFFADFEEFKKQECLSWYFGNTHRKYGVMDYAKFPVDMDENKGD